MMILIMFILREKVQYLSLLLRMSALRTNEKCSVSGLFGVAWHGVAFRLEEKRIVVRLHPLHFISFHFTLQSIEAFKQAKSSWRRSVHCIILHWTVLTD